MRGLGVLLLSALLAALGGMIVQILYAERFGAGEELIVPMMGLIVLVLTVMVVFGIAVSGGASKGTITRLAIGFASLLVLAILAMEGFAFWQTGRISWDTEHMVFLGILVPALVAILIQWWFVHRHVKKRAVLKNG